MNKDAKLIRLQVSGEDCWYLDVDQAELKGTVYHALMKCDEFGTPDEECHMMVEKEMITKSGEIELVPVADPKEFNSALDMMIARQGINAISSITDENGCFEMEDEDGNEVRFELIDSIEHNGIGYHAVIAVDDDEESFIVLKQFSDESGVSLGTIDDDNEYEKVGNLFLERFADSSEEEE